MSSEAWKILVQKYADGREICNCGHAYYSPCGKGIDSTGKARTDMMACQYGCDANKAFAKEEISKRLLNDLQ